MSTAIANTLENFAPKYGGTWQVYYSKPPAPKPEMTLEQITRRGPGDIIEISIQYDKGEDSGWRGIGVHIQTTRRYRDANGSISEVNGTYDALRILEVKPLNRQNNKEVLAVAAKLDPHAREIAHIFERDPDAAIQKVKDVLGGVQ